MFQIDASFLTYGAEFFYASLLERLPHRKYTLLFLQIVCSFAC